MRKQFQLSEEDEQCLAALGFEWEAIIEGNTKWLIVQSYPIPEGYNHRKADAALRISPSYPDDQIDMVYFYPALALTNGKAVRQLTRFRYGSRNYSRGFGDAESREGRGR